MSTEPIADRARAGPVGPTRLWFGLLGGAMAWLAHLMIAYTVAEFGCVASLGRYIVLGISVVAWMVLALSTVTLAVAVVATVVAYRSQQRLTALPEQEWISEGAGYAARAGWITSGLFALTIAVETLPILYYLREC